LLSRFFVLISSLLSISLYIIHYPLLVTRKAFSNHMHQYKKRKE
jgi:hypothetical protein